MAKEEILIKLPYVHYDNDPTPSGDDKVDDWGYYVDKDENGNEVTVFGIIGSHSQSEFINSFADNCDLKKLLERFRQGDGQALNVKTGEFVDVSNVPQSMVDAYNLIKNSQEIYDQLPDEVKAQLANDPIFAGFGASVKNEQDVASKDEVAQLKAEIEELKKGGVKYE